MFHYKDLQQAITGEKILRCFWFAGVPALIFFGSSLFLMRSMGFTFVEIMRDPAQQTGQSSFLGFLSNIGVWLWVSATAICFFSAKAVDLVTKKQRELLYLVGTLSLLLAIDDFFMIHDRYVGQRICYLVYAVFALTLLLRYHRKILEIDGFSFLIAGSFLALSILTDLLQRFIPLPYGHHQILEEGFKFVGSALWLYFCCQLAAFRRPAAA